jgi:hypothetical protein
VACAVPDFGKDPQLVYSQVATAYKFVVNEQINGKLPEPIEQLARIPFFRLFVALTFDDLLRLSPNCIVVAPPEDCLLSHPRKLCRIS